MGRISSMRRQYSKKAKDVHPPVAATISGGTPARSSSTAPPIRKLWPWTCVSPALDQIPVQNDMNLDLVMCSQPPSRVW
jgi:hypothetical protein